MNCKFHGHSSHEGNPISEERKEKGGKRLIQGVVSWMVFVVGTIRATDGDYVNSLCLSSLSSCAGSIRMLKDERKQWELQVDHSLFAIGKLDVTVSK